MSDSTPNTVVSSIAMLDLSKSDGVGVVAKTGIGFSGGYHVRRVGDELLLKYADGSAVRLCGLQA